MQPLHQYQPYYDYPPAPPRRQRRREPEGAVTFATIILAAIGAVIGAMITEAVHAKLGMQLLGTAAGAVVTELIVVLARARTTTVLAGIAIVTAGFGFAYLGVTATDYLAERPPTLWVPPQLPQPSPTSVTPSPPPPRHSWLEASPGSVECDEDGCGKPITVTSTGSDALRVNEIGLEGDHADDFHYESDCEQRLLLPTQSCSIRMWFTASADGPRRARLVIEHNAPVGRTHIDLRGDGTGTPMPQPDLTVSSENVTCSRQRYGGSGGAEISFDLLVHNADGKQRSLVVALTSDNGQTETHDVEVVDGRRVQLTLPESWNEDGFTAVDVAVDPDNQIAEPDEDNNHLHVECPEVATTPTPTPAPGLTAESAAPTPGLPR